DRERVAVIERAVLLVREDAVVVGVLAGEVGRPGRATERIGDVAVAEGGALGGEQGKGVAHHEHVGDVLIVGVDQDHVRALLLGVATAQLAQVLPPSIRLTALVALRRPPGEWWRGGAGPDGRRGAEGPGRRPAGDGRAQ